MSKLEQDAAGPSQPLKPRPPHRLKPNERQSHSATPLQWASGRAEETGDNGGLLEPKKPETRVGIAMQDTSDEFYFWWGKFKKIIQIICCVIFHLLITGYFIWATWYYLSDEEREPIYFCQGYGFLIVLFIIFYLLIFYLYVFKPYIKLKLVAKMTPCYEKINHSFSKPIVKWSFCGVLVFLMLLFIFIDCALDNDWERLIPIVGVFTIVLLFIVFSKYPGYIELKPIISGFTIQFLFGLLTIRWEFGREVFECIGEKVANILKFGIVGSEFVYGDLAVFAFTALSVTYFVVAAVQILYYFEWVQGFVVGFGSFLQLCIGTTIIESVNAAANMFLSMVEAPIMLAPYLPLLTLSELHTIITSGFATVAGIVLAAYINFGANAAHLIVASVMAAPASLVLAKIFYPETQHSLTTKDNIVMVKSAAENAVDAACQGAQIAIEIVLGIIANTIAFVSLVAFIDGILEWLGLLVGQENWSLVDFSSYIFIPLVFLMGIPWNETQIAAKIIATKVVINEFVAFKELGKLKTNQELTGRTLMILTYAICGFANPSSIGIIISTIGFLAPKTKHLLSHIVIRAFVAGTASNFMTACVCAMLTPKSAIK